MCSSGSSTEKLEKRAFWKTYILVHRLLSSGHATWKNKNT